jgi:hypothetical protein
MGEFLENDQDRQDAPKTHNYTPGYYEDAYSYPYQDEETFGLIEYQQELAEIRRKRIENNKTKEQHEE